MSERMEQMEAMAARRRGQAQELRFFDANVWLGEPCGFPLAEELNVAKLAETLRRRFITGGLVSHWDAKRISAQEGNAALAQSLNQSDSDLFAVWTGLPLYPRENGPLLGGMDFPRNVRAVRIFPKSHNFPLADWCVGTLCDELASRRMPLLVWHTEIDWAPLYQLARAFPRLKIVVETQPQKILYHTRPLFALMRDCGNVLVEISNFAGQGFIEYAVKEFGADRLIFGSFLPVADPLVPIGMVIDAEITAEEKAMIAGGNLRQMVAEVGA